VWLREICNEPHLVSAYAIIFRRTYSTLDLQRLTLNSYLDSTTSSSNKVSANPQHGGNIISLTSTGETLLRHSTHAPSTTTKADQETTKGPRRRRIHIRNISDHSSRLLSRPCRNRITAGVSRCARLTGRGLDRECREEIATSHDARPRRPKSPRKKRNQLDTNGRQRQPNTEGMGRRDTNVSGGI